MQQNKNTVPAAEITASQVEYKGLAGVRRVRAVKESVIEAQIARLVKKYGCASAEELVERVEGYQSLEDMKADLREAKVLQYAALEENALQDRLLEQVAQKMKAEIPPAILAQRVNDIMTQMQEDCRAQHTTLEAYLGLLKQTEEAFRAQLREKESLAIRKELALKQIAAAEGVTITAQEVQAEYEAIAAHRGSTLADAKKGLTEETVAHALAVRKARALLVEYANLTTRAI